MSFYRYSASDALYPVPPILRQIRRFKADYQLRFGSVTNANDQAGAAFRRDGLPAFYLMISDAFLPIQSRRGAHHCANGTKDHSADEGAPYGRSFLLH
ncbi:hypothetical protein AYR46_08390 [Sphingobium yanoikuyae]|nr:hypothetical protein AYR46_08390 [Sphingobium yanoikuyae]